MTIQALINKLEKAKKKIGTRAHVCLDLREIRESFWIKNEEYSHMDLNVFGVESIRWEKEDSFELADGSERIRTVVVLS